MNLKAKRAFIYFRVSSDDQVKGHSLSDQQERLKEFCQSNQMIIAGTFTEDCSATTFKRPKWQEMLRQIRSGSVTDYILFTNWSRFSRAENMGESFTMIDLLIKYHVEPQAIEQWIDFSIPESKYLTAFYIASPAVENLRRASNTINGIRRALKDGRYCRPAPFGYLNSRDQDKKPIILQDPDKAQIIEQVFLKYLSGENPTDIMTRALADGYYCKSKSAFARIITNVTYGGLVRVPAYRDQKEQIVKGLHTGIVDEQIFWAAYHRFNGGHAPKLKAPDERLPLRGVLQCQSCGGFLTGSRSKGKYNYFWYYRCLKCRGENYSAIKAHREFDQILEGISLTPEEVKVLTRHYETELHTLITEGEQKAVILNREILHLQSKLNSLEEKYLDDKIEDATYRKWSGVYRRQLVGKQIEADSFKVDKAELLTLYHESLPRLTNLKGIYLSMNLKEKLRFVQLVFDCGLFKTLKGYRTPKLHPIFTHNHLGNNLLEITMEIQNVPLTQQIPISRPKAPEIELFRFIANFAA